MVKSNNTVEERQEWVGVLMAYLATAGVQESPLDWNQLLRSGRGQLFSSPYDMELPEE